MGHVDQEVREQLYEWYNRQIFSASPVPAKSSAHTGDDDDDDNDDDNLASAISRFNLGAEDAELDAPPPPPPTRRSGSHTSRPSLQATRRPCAHSRGRRQGRISQRRRLTRTSEYGPRRKMRTTMERKGDKRGRKKASGNA